MTNHLVNHLEHSQMLTDPTSAYESPQKMMNPLMNHLEDSQMLTDPTPELSKQWKCQAFCGV